MRSVSDAAPPAAERSWPARAASGIGRVVLVAVLGLGWLTAIVLVGLGAFSWYVPGWTEVGTVFATAGVLVGLVYFIVESGWLPWP
jgi:hypothetical protein